MREQQSHPRIPDADLPNYITLSLCLLQSLEDYLHVPIRPGCNVSTIRNKMWHFTFLAGLHFLPVALLLPETLLCLGWGCLAFATGDSLGWSPRGGATCHGPPQTLMSEAVSTRPVELKATLSPRPLIFADVRVQTI